MTDEMVELLHIELVTAEQRVAELEQFVAWVAWHTCQKDINREAHRLLGHRLNPDTVELLADKGERS